jgi:hypothetical protein
VHTVGGLAATGPLEQLGDGWSVDVGGAKPGAVKAGDLISLRRVRTLLPPFPRQDFILFANGDRLPADVRLLHEEKLQVSGRLGGPPQDLFLPQSSLSLIWWAVPDGQDRVTFLRRLAGARRRHDTLYLRNGDSVEGTLGELDPTHVQLETAAGKKLRLERDKVAVLALSTELVRSLRPRTPYARLILANGARLSLESALLQERTLIGKTLFDTTVQISLDELLALNVYQGKAVYLSDRKPRRYEYSPFFGVNWPYRADASVSGRDLCLAGSTYDKGLGLHSGSRLTYDLKDGYQWFEAQVGLDDETGKLGSVRVDVLVDGKPQMAGGARELTRKTGVRHLRIPVTGARELTLVVDVGSSFPDVQGQVDWADARLLR